MINGKRIAVVLPAYNAEKTLAATVAELPELVDICILVDDHSSDRTVEIAERKCDVLAQPLQQFDQPWRERSLLR